MSFAQAKKGEDKREFKFGNINLAEFETVPEGADSAAAAIKLFDVGSCFFRYQQGGGRGFVYVYTRHVRIKILNKTAYDLGDFEIGLYRASTGGNKESVTAMQGATYNLEGGKVVESKLTKDARFTERVDKNVTVKKYALPNIKEGSIIEYKYTIESDFIFNLRGWNFQTGIPTKYSEYTVIIPEYFFYKPNLTGHIPISRPINNREEAVSYITDLNSTAKRTKYVAENVPALKDEPFVTTLDDYRARIDFELEGTRFPNQVYKDLTGTWPSIVKRLVESSDFGQYIKKRSAAKTLVEKIVGTETDEMVKLNLIYDYIQNNVKWSGDYSLWATHSSPKELFEKRTGNSADINLALVSLLTAANITASPVLISTRENGAHPGYPVLTEFNNVIVNAQLGDETILLDACEDFLPIGMLAFENLAHQGFNVDISRSEGQWILIAAPAAGESTFNYNLSLTPDLVLQGTVLEHHRGYNAWKRRNQYVNAGNESDYLKSYKNNRDGLGITSYQIRNLDTLSSILTERFDVEIDGNVDVAGNLLFFNPLLFERTKENPFKLEERNFPVDFGYPIKETFRIIVTIPEGYSIETLPKGMAYKLPEDGGSFTIAYAAEDDKLSVRSVIDLKKDVYSPAEYFNLKALFNVIVERHAEQIVLKSN